MPFKKVVPAQSAAIDRLAQMPLINRTNRKIDQIMREQIVTEQVTRERCAQEYGPPPYIFAPTPPRHDFGRLLERRPPPAVSSSDEGPRQRSTTGRYRDLKDRVQQQLNARQSRMAPASDQQPLPQAKTTFPSMPSAYARKQEPLRSLPTVQDQPMAPWKPANYLQDFRRINRAAPKVPSASDYQSSSREDTTNTTLPSAFSRKQEPLRPSPIVQSQPMAPRDPAKYIQDLRRINRAAPKVPSASHYQSSSREDTTSSTMPSVDARKQEPSRPLPIVQDLPTVPRRDSEELRIFRRNHADRIRRAQVPPASEARPLPRSDTTVPARQSSLARKPEPSRLSPTVQDQPLRPIRVIRLSKNRSRPAPAAQSSEPKWFPHHFESVDAYLAKLSRENDAQWCEGRAEVMADLEEARGWMVSQNQSVDRTRASSSSVIPPVSSKSQPGEPTQKYRQRVTPSGSLLAGGSMNERDVYDENEEGSTWSASLHHSEAVVPSPTRSTSRSSTSVPSTGVSTVVSGEYTLGGGPRYGQHAALPSHLFAGANESDDSIPAYLLGEGPSVDESGDKEDEEERTRSVFTVRSQGTMSGEEEKEEEQEEEEEEEVNEEGSIWSASLPSSQGAMAEDVGDLVSEEGSVWSVSLPSSEGAMAEECCREQQQQEGEDDEDDDSSSSTDSSWSQLASSLANRVNSVKFPDIGLTPIRSSFLGDARRLPVELKDGASTDRQHSDAEMKGVAWSMKWSHPSRASETRPKQTKLYRCSVTTGWIGTWTFGGIRPVFSDGWMDWFEEVCENRRDLCTGDGSEGEDGRVVAHVDEWRVHWSKQNHASVQWRLNGLARALEISAVEILGHSGWIWRQKIAARWVRVHGSGFGPIAFAARSVLLAFASLLLFAISALASASASPFALGFALFLLRGCRCLVCFGHSLSFALLLSSISMLSVVWSFLRFCCSPLDLHLTGLFDFGSAAFI
nr:hypothetical protein CFP56_66525 [Quercus suber]